MIGEVMQQGTCNRGACDKVDKRESLTGSFGYALRASLRMTDGFGTEGRGWFGTEGRGWCTTFWNKKWYTNPVPLFQTNPVPLFQDM